MSSFATPCKYISKAPVLLAPDVFDGFVGGWCPALLKQAATHPRCIFREHVSSEWTGEKFRNCSPNNRTATGTKIFSHSPALSSFRVSKGDLVGLADACQRYRLDESNPRRERLSGDFPFQVLPHALGGQLAVVLGVTFDIHHDALASRGVRGRGRRWWRDA